MLNQTVIVGRIANEPTITKTEQDHNVCYLTVAVQRSYKNSNGDYDTDYIPVTLWNIIAQNTIEYCHKGDLIGVKGRLECHDDKLVLLGEKVTFLNTNKEGN